MRDASEVQSGGRAMGKMTLTEALNRISELEAQLVEARSFQARVLLRKAFEDEIASFQYALAAIKQLDEDYGMDSSEHVEVLKQFIEACHDERRQRTKVLKSNNPFVQKGVNTQKWGKGKIYPVIPGYS